MVHPLATKLEQSARLSGQGRRAFERLCSMRTRGHDAGHDIVRAGQRPPCVHVILSGWACRTRELGSRRRQIVSLLLPGDACNFGMPIPQPMDHTVTSLTPVSVAELPFDDLERVVADEPFIGLALWRDTLVEAAIQREWTLSLGQRDAVGRMAHLFCELFHRLRRIGLTQGTGFELPLTQAELAEATGMTPVHANRTLQELRAKGLIQRDRRSIILPNLPALEDFARFTPNYLHVAHPDRDVGAEHG